ncbi:MAG: serine protease [Solirubrobacteraceae bacterium]
MKIVLGPRGPLVPLTVGLLSVILLTGCGGQTKIVTTTKNSRTATETSTTQTATAAQPVPEAAIAAAGQAVTPVTCYDANASGLNYYEGTAFELMNGDAISASHVVSACGVGAPLELGQIGVGGIASNGSLSNPNTEVATNDTTHDVAVVSGLPTLAGLQPERIAPQPGGQVALIGFPGNADSATAPRQLMITTGTITEVDVPRTVSAPLPEGGLQETLSDAIVVTAGSERGESGGLAIDARGRAIGVIEASDATGTILTPVSDLPIPASVEPTGPTILTMGNWTVVEPTTVAFSADAGNVVAGISWSSWTTTSAVGNGTSVIQNCVPNCATGSNTPVPATLTLSNPQDGRFTQITETRNGASTTWTYPGSWPWY